MTDDLVDFMLAADGDVFALESDRCGYSAL